MLHLFQAYPTISKVTIMAHVNYPPHIVTALVILISLVGMRVGGGVMLVD
jgi:hypothetical protein